MHIFRRSALVAAGTLVGLLLTLLLAAGAQAVVTVSYIPTASNLRPQPAVITADYIYSINAGASSVSRTNRATQAREDFGVIASTSPVSLALNNTILYIAYANGKIAALDTTMYPPLFPSPGILISGVSDLASISFSNGKLYAASYTSKKLLVCEVIAWNSASCTATGMSQTNSGWGPYGPFLIKPWGNKLVIATGAGGFIIYDTVSLVTSEILLPGQYPIINSFDIANGILFVTEEGNGTLYVIDLLSGTIDVALTEANAPQSIIVGDGFVYVTKTSGDSIYQLDPATMTTVASWALASGIKPRGLVFDNGTLYAGTAATSGVSQLSILSGLPQYSTSTNSPFTAPTEQATVSEEKLAQTGNSSLLPVYALFALALGLLFMLMRREAQKFMP